MKSSAATQPKVKRRRPIVLASWSQAVIASARRAALHLHPGRPRIDDWEGSGYLELKVTKLGARCVQCNRRIEPGSLAIHGDTGDVGRTPRPRYFHLDRCPSAVAPRPVLRVPEVEPQSPVELAALGRYRPELLTKEEIRRVCEALAGVEREGVAC